MSGKEIYYIDDFLLVSEEYDRERLVIQTALRGLPKFSTVM